jgi:hypothetical protein
MDRLIGCGDGGSSRVDGFIVASEGKVRHLELDVSSEARVERVLVDSK